MKTVSTASLRKLFGVSSGPQSLRVVEDIWNEEEEDDSQQMTETKIGLLSTSWAKKLTLICYLILQLAMLPILPQVLQMSACLHASALATWLMALVANPDGTNGASQFPINWLRYINREIELWLILNFS